MARWLRNVLLGVALLVLGVFAFLGLLFLTRGTPLSYVAGVGASAEPPAVGTPAFASTVSLLTGAPLGPAASVAITADGDETFPLLWRDLRSARRSVTAEIYFAEPGVVADSLAAVLAGRARAGVRVLLLYDAFGTTLGSDYFEALRRAGVRVAEFRPVRWFSLHKAQQRAHVRAFVVDGRVGWTGGVGIADAWLGTGRSAGSWRDTNARFTGWPVSQLQAAFVVNWVEATGELLTGDIFFPRAPAPAGDSILAAVVHSAPGLGSTVAERLLALSIAGARRSLYVTNAYFIPDDDFRRLLIDAASRGVDVRVLVPGEHTDVPLTRLAGSRNYEELVRGGVRIYEYRPAMIHAKTLVVDGLWSLVGSINFDNRSIALNNEATLAVQDPATGATLDSLFFRDLRYAREIRLPELQHPSLWQRIQQSAAALLGRLL